MIVHIVVARFSSTFAGNRVLRNRGDKGLEQYPIVEHEVFAHAQAVTLESPSSHCGHERILRRKDRSEELRQTDVPLRPSAYRVRVGYIPSLKFCKSVLVATITSSSDFRVKVKRKSGLN